MSEQEITLKEAIYLRKSVRNFDLEKDIDPEIADNLANVFQNFNPSISGGEIGMELLALSDAEEVFEEVEVKAPYYLAFFGDMEKECIKTDVGRLAQRMVLTLCSYGLGTCYLGDLEPQKTDEFEYPYIITVAFGYQGLDKPFRANLDNIDRKPLRTLISVSEDYVEDEVLISMLHAARVAPSWDNNQPWRFEEGDGVIHVWSHKPRFPAIDKLLQRAPNRKIDIGAAIANMEVTAESLGYKAPCARLTKEERSNSRGIMGAEYEGSVGYLKK